MVFGIFLFAAVATPTGDPLTMTSLAVPLCVLSSLGLLLRAAPRPKRRAATAGLTRTLLRRRDDPRLDAARRRRTDRRAYRPTSRCSSTRPRARARAAGSRPGRARPCARPARRVRTIVGRDADDALDLRPRPWPTGVARW